MEEKVKLYVDDSRESRRAEEFLKNSNIPYDRILSSRSGPSAQINTDFFTGLTGVALVTRLTTPKKTD